MRNSSYWPYVSNLAGSFSKAKWTVYIHAHKHKHKSGQKLSVMKEHKRKEQKKQNYVLVMGLDKGGITREYR